MNTMKTNQKQALYESIMRSVAKEVKKALNEADEYIGTQNKDIRNILRKYRLLPKLTYVHNYGWFQGYDETTDTLLFECGLIVLYFNWYRQIFSSKGIEIYGQHDVREHLRRSHIFGHTSLQKIIEDVNNGMYYVPTYDEFKKQCISTQLIDDITEFVIGTLQDNGNGLAPDAIVSLLCDINSSRCYADKFCFNVDYESGRSNVTLTNNQKQMSFSDMLTDLDEHASSKAIMPMNDSTYVTIPVFSKISASQHIDDIINQHSFCYKFCYK